MNAVEEVVAVKAVEEKSPLMSITTAKGETYERIFAARITTVRELEKFIAELKEDLGDERQQVRPHAIQLEVWRSTRRISIRRS